MNALQTKHSRFTWLPAMVSLAFALAFALAFNPCAAFADENDNSLANFFSRGA